MANRRNIIAGAALLVAAPLLIGAVASSVEDSRTIVTVTGRAEQPRQPPFVVISAGVASDARTAAAAVDANARTMARLRDTLSGMEISAEDVRTANLSLAPRRESNAQSRIIGFTANHRLTITFRDITRSGSVLDALVAAGATDIQGPNMSWHRSEESSPEMRAAAIRDANQQAEAYARSLGLRVRRVLTMRDGGAHVTNAPQAVAHRGETQIMPGEETVHTTVSAEYELVR